jgi:hypothetical protein
MKRYEFYQKYKVTYPPTVNPVFYKKNYWLIVLQTLVAVSIEPLMLYKYQRSAIFSFNNYLHLMELCFLIAFPFIALFIWLNWRESMKRSRGYGWLGKFEVVGKKSWFVFHYLRLAPGNGKLKVDRDLFEKIRVGNIILIRRDALGKIEDVRKVNNLSSRLGSGVSGRR